MKATTIRLSEEDRSILKEAVRWLRFFPLMYLTMWIVLCIILFLLMWVLFRS